VTRLTRLLAIVVVIAGWPIPANGNPAPCANNLPKTGAGTAITLASSTLNDSMSREVCAGSFVTLAVTASDRDVYGEPIICQDTAPTISWSNGGSGSSCTYVAPSTPGSYTVTCTASDGGDSPGQPGYDGQQYMSWTVIVKGITALSGPSDARIHTQYFDNPATFTATGCFGSTPSSAIAWSGNLENATYSYGSNSCSVTCRYSTGGPKTVTASGCGQMSVTVLVKVPCTECCLHPDCSASNPCSWYDPRNGKPCECEFCTP